MGTIQRKEKSRMGILLRTYEENMENKAITVIFSIGTA